MNGTLHSSNGIVTDKEAVTGFFQTFCPCLASALSHVPGNKEGVENSALPEHSPEVWEGSFVMGM